MYQIGTLNKISKVGLDNFDEKYLITDKIENANGILVRSQDMHDMEFPEKLEAVARAGAGVNNIPLDRCAQKGIVVFNTPGANANAVKELVICGLLLASRNIPSALNWVDSLTEDISKSVEKGKSQFAGREIQGKTIGIIGLGAIGKSVAKAASDLGMRVLAYEQQYITGGNGITVYTDLEEMLPLCDFLTIHIPASSNNLGLVDSDFISNLKEGVCILNFSRDKLVVDEDLIKALESGKVSQYVTDFPNDKLKGIKNVIPLPHLGASTAEAEENCASMAVMQLMDFFENGNLTNSVNFPPLNMGPNENGKRLVFIVKNMADPVTEIMEHLSTAHIPVLQIMSSRRDDGISYVLVETVSHENSPLLFHGDFATKIIAYRQL